MATVVSRKRRKGVARWWSELCKWITIINTVACLAVRFTDSPVPLVVLAVTLPAFVFVTRLYLRRR